MKKHLFFIYSFILIILVGCSGKSTINSNDEHIYLRLQDSYLLEATHPLGLALNYEALQNTISVSKDGLITANKAGISEVRISAKNTIPKVVTVEVVNNPEEMRVHFIDVGQADAIFVRLPNHEALLIDCGLDYEGTTGGVKYPSWENIQATLEKEDVSLIDHLIITHNHSDHYYYLPSILDNYHVDNIYAGGSKRTNAQYLLIMRAIQSAGLVVQIVESKDFIIDEGYLQLQIITTKTVNEDDDINHSSIIAKLTYYNRSFMFTGDAGYSYGDGESRALESGINLKSDVLKVGHHGSANSSGNPFLKAVKPTYAVFTTAIVTSTGHPHDSALTRITKIGATILQTKDQGTITFTTDGFALSFSTQKNP